MFELECLTNNAVELDAICPPPVPCGPDNSVCNPSLPLCNPLA